MEKKKQKNNKKKKAILGCLFGILGAGAVTAAVLVPLKCCSKKDERKSEHGFTTEKETYKVADGSITLTIECDQGDVHTLTDVKLYVNGKTTYATEKSYSMVDGKVSVTFKGVNVEKTDKNAYIEFKFEGTGTGSPEKINVVIETDQPIVESSNKITVSNGATILTYELVDTLDTLDFLCDVQSADVVLPLKNGSTQTVAKSDITEIRIGKINSTISKTPDYFICDFDNVKLVDLSSLDTITELGEDNIAYCRKLTSIAFPSKIKSVGGECLDTAESLQTVTLPSTLEEIGYRFCASSSISSLSLPSSLTIIGNQFCAGSGNIEQIEIPSSVVKIGSNFMLNCDKLLHVTLNGTFVDNDSIDGMFCYNCDKLLDVDIKSLPASVFKQSDFTLANNLSDADSVINGIEIKADSADVKTAFVDKFKNINDPTEGAENYRYLK